ncbi:MAG: hypothetical protein A3E01_08900 [Gammaproteobacteria bacterium RIFCSPHIGHO2_12_FULL_63_22]|nr:MAG: hypothetical protein A3E01_08900 [Gammaproteobacteria bacterium RIFCSPHIGHO2_12_FULL_63_22]
MKILLPVRFQSSNWLGGANYFLSLVSAIGKRAADDVRVFVATNRPEAFNDMRNAGVTIVEAPWLDPDAQWDYKANAVLAALTSVDIRLYSLARQLGASVISHVVPGRLSPCPALFWMPDFQHCHYPEFFSERERWSRDRNITASKRSGHLLVSSQSAARDFRRFFPHLSAVDVHVVPFSPLLDPGNQPATREVLEALGIQGKFFFLPNQFWRHKNHSVVVEALRQLPESFQVISSGAISDYRGDGHIHELLKRITSYDLTDRFRLLGVLPRNQMMALMTASVAVINPSLFEGWSSTVEEGKAQGKRLILSDIDVHREQAAVGAIYFDPKDPADLAAAMARALAEFDPATEQERAALAPARYAGAVKVFAERYIDAVRIVARHTK